MVQMSKWLEYFPPLSAVKSRLPANGAERAGMGQNPPSDYLLAKVRFNKRCGAALDNCASLHSLCTNSEHK